MGPYSLVDAQITVGKNLSVSAASQVDSLCLAYLPPMTHHDVIHDW